MTERLQIRVLGAIAVVDHSKRLELPASRKARALLGYLALSQRPVRRERLCEMFWDLPDDPRGSLRWTLTKLRKVVDTPDAKRIVADRERVRLDLSDIDVDALSITDQLERSGHQLGVEALQQMLGALEGTLLSGLDGVGGKDFKSWLQSEREDTLALKVNVLRQLTLHPAITEADRVKWAQRHLASAPYDVDATAALVAAYQATGRTQQADQTAAKFSQLAQERGIELPRDFAKSHRLASLGTPPKQTTLNRLRLHKRRQKIEFCKASDDINIAYAKIGKGKPLVKAANWLNHLELDWESPIWGRSFLACAQNRRFIRYDERGNGLSDWDVPELSMDAFVADLEAVVDALGLEQFPLLGISQGCAVSIAYAARHPERVSGLILISGYATGWRIGASEVEKERREAILTLTRHGWGTPNPAYRRLFSQTFMPDAKPRELDWFDEFQRLTTSPENAVRFQNAFGDIDVREDLPRVQAPTIVFHANGDQRISIDQGREVANGIPNAEFIELDSRNHILLGSEPAWQTCLEACAAFVEKHQI